MTPGLYHDVPMRDYLAIDAIGSSRLEHLGVSPLHYRYMGTVEDKQTDAMVIGTAVHMAVLQPDLFDKAYAPEPSLEEIGGAKPRATNAYRTAVAAIEASGRVVLRAEEARKVALIANQIFRHPHASALLARATEREVTGRWEVNGRECRGRFDALGDGVLGDLKTTRKLKDFSPWTITRMGYYRQLGFYRDGLRRLGREVKHAMIIAVENVEPYDVGVFVLNDAMLDMGMQEAARLLALLEQCERTGNWPGMYPDIVEAQLSDAVALQMPDLEGED